MNQSDKEGKKYNKKTVFSINKFLDGSLEEKYIVNFGRGYNESNSPLFFDTIKEVKRFIRQFANRL